MRIPYTDPLHEQHVKDAIGKAQVIAERDRDLGGIGVIDFHDATVVVISAKIPYGEVFYTKQEHTGSLTPLHQVGM